ncbi:hypothetical protein NQ314_019062 [Rhamnusium bicolor]|uniref:Uncharacterized protein n=1 Tax=Rhamnusium bicolor TaxID=1586634 RepID=A0AAV8WP49_9CUCU|nr:hypothetical protein NQ314_019062 [Rhamnusium bicolor]
MSVHLPHYRLVFLWPNPDFQRQVEVFLCHVGFVQVAWCVGGKNSHTNLLQLQDCQSQVNKASLHFRTAELCELREVNILGNGQDQLVKFDGL